MQCCYLTFLASYYFKGTDENFETIKELDETTDTLEEITNKVFEETGVIMSAIGIYSFNTKDKEAIEIKNKYLIDTVCINKILLENLGVPEKNIIDSKICSVCNSEKINSYRVEGKDFKRGKWFSWASIFLIFIYDIFELCYSR